ncbi:MAG: DUF5698 domain-containing protein [Anaerolineae bacterium]|jgi:uncharacterized protein YebE (UPF0316 family)|nr:DUF5698 domain-containing protein [Anaerolineae bacterium]
MITPEALLGAGLIFVLRVLNYAVSTVRTVAIARGRRLISSVLAFVEAFLFAVVIASIVQDITGNLLNLLAYCFGAAAGGWVGMVIEARFITGYVTATVIAHDKPRGHDIAIALRGAGFGVTETMGEGLSGPVAMLRSVISKREVRQVLDITRAIDPQAFVAVEEAHAIHRGWLKERDTPRARNADA